MDKRQKDRQIDRQLDKQLDRQIDIYIEIDALLGDGLITKLLNKTDLPIEYG